MLEVRDLAQGEVIPSLASPEEFNKAGVDRQYFLTDLKFTPVVKPNGKSVIRVTSTKPVREPYLNFLVEVLWPNGRLLREYTVLLDPPMYPPHSGGQLPAPRLPVATAPSRRRPADSRAGSASRVTPPARLRSRPAPASCAGSRCGKPDEGDRTPASNDTLWEIAQSQPPERHRAPGDAGDSRPQPECLRRRQHQPPEERPGAASAHRCADQEP